MNNHHVKYKRANGERAASWRAQKQKRVKYYMHVLRSYVSHMNSCKILILKRWRAFTQYIGI